MRLVLFIDEGQVLAIERNFASKMLQLRHSGISLVLNCQNVASLPLEISGNTDAFVSFQLTDERDKRAFGQLAGLNREQVEYLGRLDRGECIYFLPTSGWKHAGLGTVPELEFTEADEESMNEKAQAFLDTLTWKPLEQAGDAESSGLRAEAVALLRDLLEREFDSLTQRWLRLGVRSRSLQQAIQKELVSKGYVKSWVAVDVDGRKVLLEPLDKAFELLDVERQGGKGIGGLLHRYYQIRTRELYERLSDHRAMVEAQVNGKSVDVLVQLPDGGLRSHEIAVSLGHELANARAVVEHVSEHWILCSTKDQARRLAKKFDECRLLESWNGRIRIMQFCQMAREMNG